MHKHGRHAAVFLLGAHFLSAYAAEGGAIRFSGYYKNLFSHSTTLIPEAQSYNADVNRLRLQVQGQVSPMLGFELQYDNELLLGSYLRTRQFDRQKETRANQFWRLDSNYAESSRVYGRHRLYRGFITLSVADTDMRIGRQRVTWGTGRFWSPLDVLNPISPVQLEREERPGVDALLLERKLGELSRVSIAYAPQHARADSSAAVYWHGNAAGIDISLLSGRFAGDRMLGGDIATQLGQAGLRGEFSYTMPRSGRHYHRVLAGLDYAFANTLRLSAEFFYNGAGTRNAGADDVAALFSNRVQSPGRRYVGLFASYDITPLLKTQHHVVANLQDRSRYFGPSLIYSIRTNLDLTIGAQLFGGHAESEYGRWKNVYYTQVQWFF